LSISIIIKIRFYFASCNFFLLVMRNFKRKHLILLSAGIILILVCYFVIYVFSLLGKDVPLTSEIYITIPKNAEIEKVISIFNSSGMFYPAWLFELASKTYAKLNGKQLVAGCYRIPPGCSNFDVIKSIYSGNKLVTVTVTYPEGITLKDFASISAQKIGIDSAEFMRIALSDSFLSAFDIDAKSPEGYLMPSTYVFNWKQQPLDILERLVNQQNKIWNEKYASLAKAAGKSRHYILTLASIIEAETPSDSERPRIAGVYYNRLKRGWKLESDPTVQYGLGTKRRLTYNDLERPNPYNTYLNYGLPPGPINSPSLSSIEAALKPEKNNYMFFVSKENGSRTHNFAENFAQHQKNVTNYRKSRRR